MNNNEKKYTLCIETTSSICGIAVVFNDRVLFENNIDNGLNHSITLFNNIANAFRKLNINISDIKLIKVSNGPGSFTGLRIGIAAALGLAKPYNTKIEYVDTLDSLAYNVFKIDNKIKHNYKHYILSMIDARVDRVYLSLFDGTSFKKLSRDVITTIDGLCFLLNKYFTKKNIYFSFVGSGSVNYKNMLCNKLTINYNIYDNVSNLCASSLYYINGIESNVPFTNYLLASKAERERNKI